MDKVDEVPPKKRGRPKKEVEVGSPIGEYRSEQAKKERESLGSNPVVETYWVLKGHKLLLIKKKKSGREISTYVGSVKEKLDAPVEYKNRRAELLKVIREKEAAGKLKRM